MWKKIGAFIRNVRIFLKSGPKLPDYIEIQDASGVSFVNTISNSRLALASTVTLVSFKCLCLHACTFFESK